MTRAKSKDQIEKVKDKKADSWAEDADNRNPKAVVSKKLEKTTIRIHPDVLRAIERKAAADRRKPADVIRDLLAKGMTAEGIYL